MPEATSPSWDALYATAELQAGYFTTAQGAEAGYSPQLLYKHLKAGRIRRVRRGVYRLVHFPMSDDEHLVECWLWAEQAGVFSHETALFYHDLSDVLPKHVHLTVPEEWRGRRLRVPEGLVLHHGHVPDAERTWLGPVPITKPARAIRDVIDAHLSPEHVERALADARYRGLLDGDEADQLEARLRETQRTPDDQRPRTRMETTLHMTPRTPSVAGEVERYLRTGDTDPHHTAWSGQTFLEKAQRAHADLENALVAEVSRRANGWQPPPALVGIEDLAAFTRDRVEPMIRGLFPRAEQDAVLALVERSVVFLTPNNIEASLRASRWPRSAWDIANLYLGATGADLLSEDAPQLLGISEETTCYVSPAYFDEDDPFADFVVHEVAHIFHNCKRRSAGLRETRRKEWLLDIEFRRRETFAYACEAYACVQKRAKLPAERIALAAELRDDFGTGDARVEPGEVAEIVRAAAERRNGWKVILERCAPASLPRRAQAVSEADLRQRRR